MMATPPPPTGNPVFDFKASFRMTAQSIQRVLMNCGLVLLIAGVAARFIVFNDVLLNRTLRCAPVLGVALIVLSCAWAFAWRNKLRRDFQREFSLK